MPQDTTIAVLNANVDTLQLDSLPRQTEKLYQQIIHKTEVQDAQNKKDSFSIDSYTPLFVGIFMLAAFIYIILKEAREENNQRHRIVSHEDADKTSLTYDGNELNFSDEELEAVLNKHFFYYTKLSFKDKHRFLQRLKKFINDKVFVIHDENGFKEMPILISASAVQISFGLNKYLLPFFSHIHIFPEEFIGIYPTLRLLEGNVSGHSINLSWKHFLNGYKYPGNGQNVGLHEFAHAFYYQYFDVGKNVERDFVAAFPMFDECGTRVFNEERLPGNYLYSDYALTNFQEFWAESVEIFFQRPADMKNKYEDLYNSICELLNQDPLNNNSNFT